MFRLLILDDTRYFERIEVTSLRWPVGEDRRNTGLLSLGVSSVGDLNLTAGPGAKMYLRRICENSRTIDFLPSFLNTTKMI